MNEKRFERWNDYSCKVKDNQEETLLNREVQELNYRSQADDMCEVLNEKEAIIQRLEKENQRVYGILEDGGVLLTRKQLLDVIGKDKCDMFYTFQKEIKDLNFVINFQEKEIGALKALLKENEGLEEAYDIAKENNELLKQKNTKLIAKIDFLERLIDGDV